MKIIFTIFMVSLLHACAVLSIDPTLPRWPLESQPQKLHAPVPEGKTKVVFLNDLSGSPFFSDGVPIKINVDGKEVGIINKNVYLQLFLKPGKHLVKLSHWDTFIFDTEEYLTVSEEDIYIKLQKFGFIGLNIIQDENPTEFMNYYRPAYYCDACNQ